jgi:hypothetical protein
MGHNRARPIKPKKRAHAIEASVQETYDEVVEFMERRPIFWAIAERCGELARQASKSPEHSADRKKLDQRFRRLEAWAGPSFYEMPKSKQDAVIFNFAQSLIGGEIGFRKRRVRTWEDVRELTDRFAKRIRTRPVGHPVGYRCHVTEALETKLAHPNRTWKQIFEQMEDELNISFDDFKRQIQLLKQSLRDEGVLIPPQQASK